MLMKVRPIAVGDFNVWKGGGVYGSLMAELVLEWGDSAVIVIVQCRSRPVAAA